MFEYLFTSRLGWERYYLPRTGYTLLGSLYFFFTLQLTLFVLHLVLEVVSAFALTGIAMLVFPNDPPVWSVMLLLGFFVPRLFIPFLMGRWETMNYLNGAWRIDWVAPLLLVVYVLSQVLPVVYLGVGDLVDWIWLVVEGRLPHAPTGS